MPKDTKSTIDSEDIISTSLQLIYGPFGGTAEKGSTSAEIS